MRSPLRPAGPLEERFHGPRRHLVADGGVGPSAVVVGLDELDHRVLGVGPGGEERLGHGAVVAVAGTVAGNHPGALRGLTRGRRRCGHRNAVLRHG